MEWIHKSLTAIFSHPIFSQTFQKLFSKKKHERKSPRDWDVVKCRKFEKNKFQGLRILRKSIETFSSSKFDPVTGVGNKKTFKHGVLSDSKKLLGGYHSLCGFTGMFLQPHWAPCAFTGPVRHTPTIPLVSLCVHRDPPTLQRGSLCLHRVFFTQDPIANPFWTHTHLSFSVCPAICLFSSPLCSLYSVSDRFCHLPSWALSPYTFIMSLSDSVWSSLLLRPSSYQRSSTHSPKPLSLLILFSQAHPNPAMYFSDSFLWPCPQISRRPFPCTSRVLKCVLEIHTLVTLSCHSIPICLGHLRLTFSKSLFPPCNPS